MICSLDYRTSLIDDKIERLRWLANSVGNDILEQYFTEIIPRFNKEDLIKFLNLVQCNVIPSILLNKSIDKMVKHFYSIGILGYIKRKTTALIHQFLNKFLPISQYAYNQNITLPKSKYYLTHPTLDDQLKNYLI